MPLYQSINNRDNTRVLIWKITESEAFLRHGIHLSDNSLKRLSTMSSELHRRGFLSIRHLLIEAGYTDLDLFYNDSGKPHLVDKKNISITHSFEFTAIVISDVPTGIDIEKQREKILRIAKKFVGFEADYITQMNRQVTALTVIWGAKESMYKLYGKKGLGFKAHCQVAPFSLQDQKTTSYIDYEMDQLSYEVFFKEIENFMMVYILPKIHD